MVRRLTLSSNVKMGSLSNLSAATAGLLSHVDFTRAKGSEKVRLDELAANLPGLKGIAVRNMIIRRCFLFTNFCVHILWKVIELPIFPFQRSTIIGAIPCAVVRVNICLVMGR